MEQKTVVRLGFLAVAALQVALLLAIVVPKERTLATGETILLQTVPVDPRDLFRGDYVVLRYTISTVRGFDFVPGDTVYVALEKRGQTWEARSASHSKPDDLFIKGRVTNISGAELRVEYGIESYFIPEGTGHVIERARDVKVKVAVDGSGKAVIKELLVDDRPFDPSHLPEEGPPVPEVPPEVAIPAAAGEGPLFEAPQRFAMGGGPRSVAVADLNGDGAPDIVTANDGSDDVSVLLHR